MNHRAHHIIRKLSKGSDKPSATSLNASKNIHPTSQGAEENDAYPDYPIYPPGEDIYSNYTEEVEIDPEQTLKLKAEDNKADLYSQLDFMKELLGEELDVPGAELDDEQERIGSEDEENNYYSLGGDNHDDLDESNGV